ESKSNCYEPFTPRPDLPICPSELAEEFGNENVNRTFFAIVGDFGLANTGCAEQVGQLLTEYERRFGKYAYVISGGDNAYWDGSCSAHANAYGNGIYGQYFPLNDVQCK